MMNLSSKCVYGVHALFELALHHGEGSVAIRNISRAQDIPEDYLRQLLVTLKKAHLVESERGVKGGYMLARSPSEITIGEIIEGIEGCFKPSSVVPTDKVLAGFWDRCCNKVKESFSATLEDLVNEKKRADENVTYHI